MSRPDLMATNQPPSPWAGIPSSRGPDKHQPRGPLASFGARCGSPETPPKCTRGSQSLKACPEGAKPAPEFAGVKPSCSRAEPELLRGRPCPHSCRRGASRRSRPGHTVATKKPGHQAPSMAPAPRKPTPTGSAAHARTGLKPLMFTSVAPGRSDVPPTPWEAVALTCPRSRPGCTCRLERTSQRTQAGCRHLCGKQRRADGRSAGPAPGGGGENSLPSPHGAIRVRTLPPVPTPPPRTGPQGAQHTSLRPSLARPVLLDVSRVPDGGPTTPSATRA